MKKPQSPKQLQQLLSEIQASGRLADILAAYDALPKRLDYLHWDDLRYRQPPAGLSSEEWWLAVKLQRKASFRDIPLVDIDRNGYILLQKIFEPGIIYILVRSIDLLCHPTYLYPQMQTYQKIALASRRLIQLGLIRLRSSLIH